MCTLASRHGTSLPSSQIHPSRSSYVRSSSMTLSSPPQGFVAKCSSRNAPNPLSLYTSIWLTNFTLHPPCFCASRKSDGESSCCTSATVTRSEEHTSELQSLMRISYAVFCLKKKN